MTIIERATLHLYRRIARAFPAEARDAYGVGGPALLAALALVACYLPARRSTRINPVSALRAE